MATVSVSRDIDAPVEAAFKLCTDIERGAEHVSGIKKIEMLSVGPLHLGSRWIEHREVLGRVDDAEMEITAFEPNKSYTITHRKAGVRIDTVFTFEPLGAGTRLTIQFGLNPQGLPPALLSPLEWAMAGRVREALSNDLADLKATIERVAGR